MDTAGRTGEEHEEQQHGFEVTTWVKTFQEDFGEKLGARGPAALGGGVRETEGNLLFLQISGLSEKTVSRTVSWVCHLHSH